MNMNSKLNERLALRRLYYSHPLVVNTDFIIRNISEMEPSLRFAKKYRQDDNTSLLGRPKASTVSSYDFGASTRSRSLESSPVTSKRPENRTSRKPMAKQAYPKEDTRLGLTSAPPTLRDKSWNEILDQRKRFKSLSCSRESQSDKRSNKIAPPKSSDGLNNFDEDNDLSNWGLYSVSENLMHGLSISESRRQGSSSLPELSRTNGKFDGEKEESSILMFERWGFRKSTQRGHQRIRPDRVRHLSSPAAGKVRMPLFVESKCVFDFKKKTENLRRNEKKKFENNNEILIPDKNKIAVKQRQATQQTPSPTLSTKSTEKDDSKQGGLLAPPKRQNDKKSKKDLEFKIVVNPPDDCDCETFDTKSEIDVECLSVSSDGPQFDFEAVPKMPEHESFQNVAKSRQESRRSISLDDIEEGSIENEVFVDEPVALEEEQHMTHL